MKKSVISVLKINSRYLQSPGLNMAKILTAADYGKLCVWF